MTLFVIIVFAAGFYVGTKAGKQGTAINLAITRWRKAIRNFVRDKF